MKVKTADLFGPALDWAVASIEVLPKERLHLFYGKPAIDREYLGRIYALRCEFSSNWAQGGPIIERERIELGACLDQWQAVFHGEDDSIDQDGPTPLIAAMRCYCCAKLGEFVEIPEELLK